MNEQDNVSARVEQLRAQINQLQETYQAQLEQDQGLGDFDEGIVRRIDELQHQVWALEHLEELR